MGSVVVFTETPHARTWGVVTGRLVGNTIRGIDFAAAHNVDTNSRGRGDMQSIWSPAVSTGTIVPSDSFTSSLATMHSSLSMSIYWTGGTPSLFGDYDKQVWSKVKASAQTPGAGYRYLKLYITEDTGELTGSILQSYNLSGQTHMLSLFWINVME